MRKSIKFPPIYKEIQMGAVAKSYMRKAFLIYDFAIAPNWISFIYEENFVFFLLVRMALWKSNCVCERV